jgi:hypothetical protein
MKAFALVLIIPALAVAVDNNGRGTKALGLANAFVAVADNSWGVSYNPGGLVQCNSFQASVFYIPQQFGLSELRTTALSASYCIKPGTVAVLIEQFGFDLYKTTTLQLGYGFFLGPTIALGASVDLEHTSISRYGAANSATLDLGFMGWPTPALTLGFALKNVTAARIGNRGDRLPQYVLLGASYTPLKGFVIVSEIEKELEFPIVVKAGIEQSITGFLSLRCGVSNNPDKFSAGFAVRYAGVEFGYAGYSHTDLGWTHQVDLTFRLDGSQ